jgi:hypothetical protein
MTVTVPSLGSARGSRAGERVLAIANFCRVYLTAPGLHVIKDCFGATPKPGRRGDRSPDIREAAFGV